jgi:hypothetical protein
MQAARETIALAPWAREEAREGEPGPRGRLRRAWDAARDVLSGIRHRSAEHQVQTVLLRDLFGNPFRPVALQSEWLVHNDGTAQRLAQSIYEERTFDRLPVLADALEEAGATESTILNHCRGPGPHVRGCWVVDLLLGKT